MATATSTAGVVAMKRRTLNFSPMQTLFLVTEVIKRRNVISGRRNAAGVTNMMRSRHWSEITQKFNACYPDSPRTVFEIKKKWDNFTNKAKKDVRIFRMQAQRVAQGGEARMRPLDQAGLLYMNYFMDQPEERLDFGTLSSHTDSETGFDIKEEADSVADESLSSVHLQPVTDSDVFRCLTEDCVFHSDADDEDGASSSATTRPPTPRLCGAACQERREVLQLMKENELQRRHLIHQRRQLAVKEDALLTLQLFKAQHEIRCLVQANPHLRLPDQVQKWLH